MTPHASLNRRQRRPRSARGSVIALLLAAGIVLPVQADWHGGYGGAGTEGVRGGGHSGANHVPHGPAPAGRPLDHGRVYDHRVPGSDHRFTPPVPHPGYVPPPRARVYSPPQRMPAGTHHPVVPVPPKVANAFHSRIVNVLPPHHQVYVRGGSRFYYVHGAWYRAHGPRYIAVVPPPGFVVRVLPPFYSVFWIGAVPYYYVNNVYYTPAPGGYAVTPPPADIITEQPAYNPSETSTNGDVTEEPADGANNQTPGAELYIYPQRGQSAEQQQRDRRECNDWAVSQTGFDPTVAAAPSDSTDAEQPADKFADYQRAMTACLEGRGYTVR